MQFLTGPAGERVVLCVVRRRASGFALVAAAIAAVGCGSSAPLSRAAYLRAGNRVCRNAVPHVPGGSYASTRFAAAEAVNEQLINGLRALRGPSDLMITVRRATAVMAQSEPFGRQLVADMRAGEQSKISTDAAGRRGAQLVDAADQFLRAGAVQLVAVGLTDCKQ